MPVKEPLIGIRQPDVKPVQRIHVLVWKMIPNKEKNPGMFLSSCFLGDTTPSYLFVQNETRWIF